MQPICETCRCRTAGCPTIGRAGGMNQSMRTGAQVAPRGTQAAERGHSTPRLGSSQRDRPGASCTATFDKTVLILKRNNRPEY